MNQERFSTTEFDDTLKIQKESRLVYYPVNTQVREEVVYKVQLTELELQDYYYQFSQLTQDDRQIFKNTWSQTRPYEFKDLNHT